MEHKRPFGFVLILLEDQESAVVVNPEDVSSCCYTYRDNRFLFRVLIKMRDSTEHSVYGWDNSLLGQVFEMVDVAMRERLTMRVGK